MSPLLLFLLALAAPGPTPHAEPPGDWRLCQQDLEISEDIGALVNLSVDGANRERENELELSSDFEATWSLRPASLAGRGAMTDFSFFMDYPPGTVFPVSVVATADGHPFWTGIQAEPNRNNGDGHGSVREMLFVGMQPGNPLPNIFGIRRLRFVATDARGEVVATGVPHLPDWGRVERLVQHAVRQNERDRRRNQCISDVPIAD